MPRPSRARWKVKWRSSASPDADERRKPALLPPLTGTGARVDAGAAVLLLPRRSVTLAREASQASGQATHMAGHRPRPACVEAPPRRQACARRRLAITRGDLCRINAEKMYLPAIASMKKPPEFPPAALSSDRSNQLIRRQAPFPLRSSATSGLPRRRPSPSCVLRGSTRRARWRYGGSGSWCRRSLPG
jgi:hypothetical protein